MFHHYLFHFFYFKKIMDFTYAEKLRRNGVVVVTHDFFKSNLPIFRHRLNETIASFPEFTKRPHLHEVSLNNLQVYTMDDTFALANPASYHNPLTRELRSFATNIMIKTVFSEYLPLHAPNDYPAYKLEHVMTPLTIYPPNIKIPYERWNANAKTNSKTLSMDQQFNGWLNLDRMPQYLLCILGSHTEKGRVEYVSDAHQTMLHSHPRKKLVEIPPGGIILFSNALVHRNAFDVGANIIPRIRQGFGWRLTCDPVAKPLVNDLDRVLADQDVPTRVGVVSPTLWPEKFSNRNAMRKFLYENVANQNRNIDTQKRSFRSLRTAGETSMYAPYADADKQLLTPQKIVSVRPLVHKLKNDFFETVHLHRRYNGNGNGTLIGSGSKTGGMSCDRNTIYLTDSDDEFESRKKRKIVVRA